MSTSDPEPIALNIYLITCPAADYDEYQAWVVMAESPDAALALVRDSGKDSNYPVPRAVYESPEDRVDIELLGITLTALFPGIAYSDFRAG